MGIFPKDISFVVGETNVYRTRWLFSNHQGICEGRGCSVKNLIEIKGKVISDFQNKIQEDLVGEV